MDAHTRKLRYFVVVAEELHFSRAAARLFIAQQALSRQIRELEDAVGTRLLARTTRSVELTPAGEVFLDAARTALAALDTGVDAALRCARGEAGVLRVGFVTGGALELTPPLLAEFGARHPDITLELHESAFTDPSGGLAEDESDVALVRLPLSDGAYDHEPLFTEPLVVGLSSTHPLATGNDVPVRDLLDEPVVVAGATDEVWRTFWRLDAHRDGRPPRKVIDTTSHTEELALVAAGVACMVTAAAAVRYTPHPSVRYLALTDVAGSTLAVAWRRGRRTAVVDRFVEVARTVRDRETETVHAIEHPAFTTA
ncbi:MAG: LysR family transcriptional regulator [Micromonosporaceae bacterium]